MFIQVPVAPLKGVESRGLSVTLSGGLGIGIALYADACFGDGCLVASSCHRLHLVWAWKWVGCGGGGGGEAGLRRVSACPSDPGPSLIFNLGAESGICLTSFD